MAQKYKQLTKDTDFGRYLKQQFKKPAIREAYDEEGLKLEIAYEINKLRKEHRLTQGELALKLNTTQSVIARIEQGNQNFTLDTLQKLAQVFNKSLKVEFA
ncbi:MAG: hypothetical protein A2445_03655 [Candidatus Jacksonbacteria bacterium RIFOXYC2_FULL_44_29]|nr:MAG: hypothetical protein UV19_C0011G0016 [Parcubacteria group bacterium GW2011_GWA2_42_28]KKT53824.1 MAG: hypothetical protein UW45_C0025G0016 [Parcubacteria group bacterium GW2011_GWC2_44_22]OGY76748.1 MAG: hypothetical protein A2240_00840 [Candidatus Jacksonbacteria bacterium RIFOXYA2_FULL_43_12]OGY77324.1 MAG: hypothetical protein A2295_03750 [Candidatus Jacksonbacteria bacterium RIFOXYB2_FULL_44_15]OGY79078.1 MAG: hypothetical protein A2550_04645 [Candidatus Jacksonbacteria bacterium RI